MYQMGHYLGMGGWWLIFISVLIIFFFFLKERPKKETDSPQDILDRRYANDEIDKEEYLKKSNDLKRH